MKRLLLATTALVLGACVTACGAAGPELGMTVRGLASVPEATLVDIQLHPSDRACSVLHETFLTGVRVPGATGTDIGIDQELLFGSIADGVYTISAVAHDATLLYADGCQASVELLAGEVTEVTVTLSRFAAAIPEAQ